MKKIFHASFLMFLGSAMFCVSCSKDVPVNTLPPTISLDQESPIYQVKIGKSITITPIVENAENGAIYLWKIDGKIVGEELSYTYHADNEPAILYIKFEVTTDYGSDEKEFCIEVVPYLTPVITMGVPEQGYSVIIEGKLSFIPEVTNSENTQFVWEVNDMKMATTKDYTFSSDKAGMYTLRLTATNEDGSGKLEFTVKVCTPEEMPYTAMFEQTEYNVSIGRTIFIRPYWIKNTFDMTCKWSVDGKSVAQNVSTEVSEAMPESGAYTFAYTPDKEGKHKVTLTMTNHYGTVVTNFTVNVCHPEGTYYRGSTGSVDCNKVYDFKAAAGQFVNEYYSAYTMDEACAYAKERMQAKGYVSLGAWGGYLVVGFDHSIDNDGDYNLQILGNAFKGSSEPGIIWVMQDENGNGLPDDTWYELKGSDYASSVQDYAVTYYRPNSTHRPVAWVDNMGNSGQIDYLGFHTQDYYYPNWIESDSYTLVGSRLTPKTVETSPGYWANGEFEWGYADNFSPTDRLTDDDNYNAEVMGNHMKISDAVRHDGKPANLKYIDFVKIHTGVNVKAGWLGENSTEVFGVQDYNMIKKK